MNLSKKTLLLILIIFSVLLAMTVTWLLNFSFSKSKSCPSVQTSLYKEVTINTIFNSEIEFSIPSNWNAFYNGDPVYITNLESYSSQQSTIVSVSTPDRPVTMTDINWTQVDFLITDGDLVTQQFIDQQKKESDQAIEPIKFTNFTGYVVTYKLQGNLPTKANTGGQRYYLRPNTPSPKWNLIISKQSKGDSSFEAGVKKILETLNYIQN